MLENISQLKKLDPQWLDKVVSELNSEAVDIESMWREPYPEYGSAGLKVAPLLNHTGEQENFDYHDCRDPKATPLLKKMVSLHTFFQETRLNMMGARLLRLDPGTFLHEHRDFVYLEPVPRFRLHAPLITNQNACITSPGINVHFERGHLWKLNPKQTVHSACNFGDKPRIHLMLDCYVNDYLADLIAGESLDEKLKRQLPPLEEAKKAELLAQAKAMLAQSNGDCLKVQAAEEVLLRTFCQYNLKAYDREATSYDLIFELYKDPAHEERRAYWQARLLEVYPPQSPAQPDSQLATV